MTVDQDARGCQTCTCAPDPGPRDCDEIACGPRPNPPVLCPDAEITCVARGDQCVWQIAACTFCPSAACGPIPNLPPAICHDGPVRPPECTRDKDAVCRWHYPECPPACVELATAAACDKVAGCQWLVRACGAPTIPATGCVDKDDIGCNSSCVAPRKCAVIYVDSCSISNSTAACADAVCRDESLVVCPWW